MYAQPFLFDIVPGIPLLVMSCSAEKANTGDAVTCISDLYCGPMWQAGEALGLSAQQRRCD